MLVKGTSGQYSARYKDSSSPLSAIVVYYMMTSSNGTFPRYWPFVRVIHWSPVNSPHKGQWRGALMFFFICAWINSWVNKLAIETPSRPSWRHCNAMFFVHVIIMIVHAINSVLGCMFVLAKGTPSENKIMIDFQLTCITELLYSGTTERMHIIYRNLERVIKWKLGSDVCAAYIQEKWYYNLHIINKTLV